MGYKHIGNNILFYLKKKNKTQVELANYLGISKQVANKIIKGNKVLKIEELIKILIFLDLEVEDIILDNLEIKEEKLENLKDIVKCKDSEKFIIDLLNNLDMLNEKSGSKYNLNEKPINQRDLKIIQEVAWINQKFSISSPGYIKDGIFDLLERLGQLVMYPIKDENFLGIYMKTNRKEYFIINTSKPLEIQIYIAGCILAYSQYIPKVNLKFFTSDIFDKAFRRRENEYEFRDTDLICYSFAEEFIVGRQVLENKFRELNKINSKEDLDYIIAILSDYFMVPYKLIIKRLVELKLIEFEKYYMDDLSDRYMEKFLHCYELFTKNWKITEEIRLSKYVEKAVNLRSEEKISQDDLINILNVVEKTMHDIGLPEEVDISLEDLHDNNNLINENSMIYDSEDIG